MAATLLAGALAAHAADLYVCAGGAAPEYRDHASAADCRKIAPAPIGMIGAGKAAAAAATSPEKGARDDGKAALRVRLASERRRLDALKREYNGGRPERRGDERNYARYQERSAALETAIAAGRAQVEALERQLER
ncbi:DUF4124 domain-containing protein [Herbaspirillum sp. WKF16]|uniref:DUF4124 domain-containing protein n=1 Tax=Herbaspirillum sp. WKF16 TaxID=3028312 RepID=UPI0023A9EFD6|nr:DUF4124 domain-containing protein [Herbaspirillum sp. WKF16]WDZ97630.1 DUF4124 domain-containing protein [Herbaspirillum sp. WKF16]